ncbi:hypothetical protein QQF64_032841 [Cirrhinus molitorella]|uniref:Uncharacterized protein n=1 Tax=Cirrhinus molitorella TaxID=172907 RepID=A0ABR3MS57_9TELE
MMSLPGLARADCSCLRAESVERGEGGWQRTPSPSASETQNRTVQSGSILRSGQAAMALVLDATHCMGAYYCLVRTRFKRRRKKRSERKGQNAFFTRPGGDL